MKLGLTPLCKSNKNMTLRYIVTSLCLLLCVEKLFGQASSSGRLVFPFLSIESQSNILVTADLSHPKNCPAKYTNVLSNTNLFSLAERTLLDGISEKYKNVTTNSGPAGSILTGFDVRQSSFLGDTDIFSVSCFAYTNIAAKEEMDFHNEGQIVSKFRTQTGDGYDVKLIDGKLFQYQEYKSNLLDGLYVAMKAMPLSDAEKCGSWARFFRGRILGKFFGWDDDGKIVVEAEFKEPFDFVKNQIVKTDLSWAEMPTNTTNSAQSPK